MAPTLIWGILMSIVAAASAAAKINCYDGNFYIRPDPDSCNHFYKCDNGLPVKFTCSSGLYYNPKLYVCDWPYNVKCENSGGQKYNENNGQYNGNNGGQKYNGDNEKYNGNNGGQKYKVDNGGQKYNGNNGEQKYNGNNGGQKYNTNNGQYNGNSGQYQYSGDNEEEQYNGYDAQQEYNGNNQIQDNDSILYPGQKVPTNPQDTSVGPSVQEPPGPLVRPRPTYDQLFSGSQHPYQAYRNQSNDFDIRK